MDVGVVVGGTEDGGEEFGELGCIEVVLAGVDVGRYKSPLGKSMIADVAFGNKNKAANATRIFAIERAYFYHHWFGDSVHAHLLWEFSKETGQVFFIR